VANKLVNVITRTCARGGKIIVPAFAVGRTQQLVLLLHELFDQQRIPTIPIFVDSPLAVQITEVFRKHSELYDDESQQFLKLGEDPFGFKRFALHPRHGRIQGAHDLHGPCHHHLRIRDVRGRPASCTTFRNNIEDPRNTILITGFQAETR